MKKQVLWKKAAGVVVAFTMIFSLTGCGGEKAASAGKETDGSKNSNSEILVSVWAGPHADLQKQISQEFSDAKVIIDDVDYNNLMQKQLTSFQAKSGRGNYDVVWVNSLWIKDYVEAGYILPISDMVAAKNIDTSIYAQGLLEDCTFDGKLYGFPTYAQSLILVYDSEVFENENLAVPQNMEELIAVARHFKEAGTGIAMPAKQGGASSTLFSQMLYSDDGDFLDANGKLDLTNEKVIQAAKDYQELAKYSVEGSLAWHHDEVAEAVRTKTAPIGIVMSGLANQNADPDKSLIVDTVGYAPLAGHSGKASACNTFWIWAVAANTANEQAAFDYCAWMASPEIEKKQTLMDQQISAITALGEDSEILEKAPYLPVVMEQLENGKSNPRAKDFAAFKEGLIASLSEIATSNADPQKVMEKLQDEMKDLDFTK